MTHSPSGSPAIENPTGVSLSAAIEPIFNKIFAGYRRVIIIKEFAQGLSGGRVLAVRPVTGGGIPELPTVLKITTPPMAQKEWQAYRQHIARRLPYIAEIRKPPLLLPEIGQAALRYSLMGGDTFEVISLRDYFSRPELTATQACQVLERLLRIMRHLWAYHHPLPHFSLRAGYDPLLPVNLLIQQQTITEETPPPHLTPQSLPKTALSPGDSVGVSGFVVRKTNPVTQTITLDLSQPGPNNPAYTLRCKFNRVDPLSDTEIGQPIKLITGRVLETRHSRLQAELERTFGPDLAVTGPAVTVPGLPQATLPNPLTGLDRLLDTRRAVNIASIHGDFNLENILVEPETGLISLIDFAEAREGHLLHDLLRLETEIITKLLPPLLAQPSPPPAAIIAALYWQLHQAVFQKQINAPPRWPQPGLQKVAALLRTIRQTARQYLFEADDFTEYYQSLILYLLGALKFKNLNHAPQHPLPKQLAFWGAAVASQLLAQPALTPDNPPPELAPLLAALSPPAAGESQQISRPVTTSATPQEAAQLFNALPLDRIPTLGTLPPHSRMPLSRNPLFVGRRQDLKALARALKGGDTVAIGQVETAAATGLGGIGKTQLASEFVHRYGRYFAGGIFWLSFADSKAIPAEVAACGGPGALDLRPDFSGLPLEEQVQAVRAAWQRPIPRLLIFDNCEAPELLARWRPASGGCRVLVTSRRIDWEPALGIKPLLLNVLDRAESIALLRNHHPDANDEILDAIAAELGDLPLALHLAGSYLARYRRTITPQKYLEQLRDPALLRHPSLQGRGVSPTGHLQNVNRTIALSYDRLEPEDPTDD